LLKDSVIYTFWAELELRAYNNSERALEVLDKARETNHSPTGYDYVLYSEALWDKDSESALDYLEKSVALDRSVSRLSRLAGALFLLGDRRALKVAKEILEKDPANCHAFILLASMAAESGQRFEALRLIERAESLEPDADDLAWVGAAYQRLGDFRRAIERYLKAVRRSREAKVRGYAYAGVTGCYISLGNAQQAQKYMKRAVRWRCDPDYAKDLRQEYRERFGRDA
jgi:tetratricopeptide (TPR) repeat protein